MTLQHGFERICGNALRCWVRLAVRYSLLVIIASVVASVLSVFLISDRLKVDTGTSKLVAQDFAFRENERRYKETFAADSLPIVIVIEASTPELAGEAANALSVRLDADDDHFVRHFDAVGDPFFQANGLLYLTPDELWALSDRVAAGQPMIALLVTDATLNGLVSLVLEGLENHSEDASPFLARLLIDLARSAEARSQGNVHPVSWLRLFAGEGELLGGDRRIIQVEPIRNFSKLRPGQSAIERIRWHISDLGYSGRSDLEIRLTGSAVMSDEERQGVLDDVTKAGLVAFVLVAVTLVVGIRSLPIIGALLTTLIAGLIWTTGLATLVFSAFNLISVSFAVLFIGLSVDFGIHFALRFSEALQNGETKERALDAAAVEIGPALLVATATTVVAFLSFAPTNYTGLAELGVISAIGMLVAFFTNLTVLPALLIICPSRTFRTVKLATRLPILLEKTVNRGALAIVSGFLILSIWGVTYVGQLRFDLNPINLRDPKAESIETFNELVAIGAVAPYALFAVANNLSDADALASKLTKLESVSKTTTASVFVPSLQHEKLEVIDSMAVMLEPVFHERIGSDANATPEAREALERFATRAPNLAAPHPDENVREGVSRLVEAVQELLAHSDETVDAFERDSINTFPWSLQILRNLLAAKPIMIGDVPEPLLRSYLAKNGMAAIRIEPDARDIDVDFATAFVEDVRAVAPTVTGPPIIIAETAKTILDSFINAIAIAMIGMAVIVAAALWSLRDTVFIILPLSIASLLTIVFAVKSGLSFNFANLIVLPLMIGLGADYAVHVVMRNRQIAESVNLYKTSTPRAIVLSALTTIFSFGSLSISNHWGMASMGLMLTAAIVIAVATTLLFLPAIMKLMTAKSVLAR